MNNDKDSISSGALIPRLSVVICTYNRVELLACCLESIVSQTLPHEDFEVVVVDNNSSDGTAQLVGEWHEKFPFIRYVLELRQGVSYARDIGWRESSGEFIAYIDDDTTAPPEWCDRILTAFTTVQPSPVAVGGNILPRLDKPSPWWFSPRLEIRSWGETPGFLDTPTAHYGFSGANMAFIRQVLSEHNGFNHDFGMSGGKVWLGEEPELFMRIYKTQPYFWFDPTIYVKHYVPDSQLCLRGRFYRAFQSGRTRKKLEKKRVSPSFLFSEICGVIHLFRERSREKPFSILFVLVSTVERISDRIGYFSGRA